MFVQLIIQDINTVNGFCKFRLCSFVLLSCFFYLHVCICCVFFCCFIFFLFWYFVIWQSIDSPSASKEEKAKMDIMARSQGEEKTMSGGRVLQPISPLMDTLGYYHTNIIARILQGIINEPYNVDKRYHVTSRCGLHTDI